MQIVFDGQVFNQSKTNCSCFGKMGKRLTLKHKVTAKQLVDKIIVRYINEVEENNEKRLM